MSSPEHTHGSRDPYASAHQYNMHSILFVTNQILQVISAFIFWNLTPYTLAVNSASAGQGGLAGRKKGRIY